GRALILVGRRGTTGIFAPAREPGSPKAKATKGSHMNVHEYQAKELLRGYGVPLAKGGPAFTVEEAVKAAQNLPGPVWVVKAQIHAGGRGKGKFKEADAGSGGGVRLAKSPDEVKTFAEQMLGKTLVTIQTGPAGRVVKRLFIEDGTAIARELYLSAL